MGDGQRAEIEMATSGRTSGGDFLARRNLATLGKGELPELRDVLLVEDESFDARRLSATLHIVLGRNVELRIANTLDQAIDAVLQATPDMVFLDDYLKPNDSALETIPLLRRAGYEGPIVIVSGEVDRPRLLELRKVGANCAIHKDDVNSVKVSEALQQAFAVESS